MAPRASACGPSSAVSFLISARRIDTRPDKYSFDLTAFDDGAAKANPVPRSGATARVANNLFKLARIFEPSIPEFERVVKWVTLEDAPRTDDQATSVACYSPANVMDGLRWIDRFHLRPAAAVHGANRSASQDRQMPPGQAELSISRMDLDQQRAEEVLKGT